MQGLLSSWKEAVKLLVPRELFGIVREAGCRLGFALWVLMTQFSWLIGACLFTKYIPQYLFPLIKNIHIARGIGFDDLIRVVLLIMSSLFSFFIFIIVLLLLPWNSSDESAISFIRSNFLPCIKRVLLIAFLVSLCIFLASIFFKITEENFTIYLGKIFLKEGLVDFLIYGLIFCFKFLLPIAAISFIKEEKIVKSFNYYGFFIVRSLPVLFPFFLLGSFFQYVDVIVLGYRLYILNSYWFMSCKIVFQLFVFIRDFFLTSCLVVLYKRFARS